MRRAASFDTKKSHVELAAVNVEEHLRQGDTVGLWVRKHADLFIQGAPADYDANRGWYLLDKSDTVASLRERFSGYVLQWFWIMERSDVFGRQIPHIHPKNIISNPRVIKGMLERAGVKIVEIVYNPKTTYFTVRLPKTPERNYHNVAYADQDRLYDFSTDHVSDPNNHIISFMACGADWQESWKANWLGVLPPVNDRDWLQIVR